MMGIFWVFISVLGVGTGLGLFAITRRGDGSDRAREILAERLARGDITPEEFRERLEALGPHVAVAPSDQPRAMDHIAALRSVR